MADRPASVRPAPQLQFQRAHKSALGFAFGLFVGGGLFLLTAIHVVLNIEGLPLGLLAQYFKGYGESLRGYDVRFRWQLRVGLAIIP